MTRRIRALSAFLAALTFGGATALAQTPAKPPRAVIELFTSQGCSSCPAADALFVELAKDPSLIALTMPVTYWDYLGWKDTLGQDVFSKRQKYYAKGRGDGQIYTPQAVINGASHMVGSDKAQIEQSLKEHASPALPVSVALSEASGHLSIKLDPTGAGSERGGGVWLVPISRLVTVPIERGENKGKSVTYANVVRGIVKIGEWTGAATTMSVPLATAQLPNADAYVVLVQGDQPNRVILGAARSPR
ncbi:thioredoxin family protein [Bosea sp. BIWAKO-01]|uniref:DUF1223 domain-containing protein n=1 Tax=Bosea sp. BIWAKO-01 TaxID=506668 RepID=UPI000852B3E7|nr:DUF1223 domain-containing protein [Bosea sp. BIWAKO-01]GAU82248.1 hypothetical protein BIWAKO_02152 [Bosea sp. BIWAKO-01]